MPAKPNHVYRRAKLVIICDRALEQRLVTETVKKINLNWRFWNSRKVKPSAAQLFVSKPSNNVNFCFNGSRDTSGHCIRHTVTAEYNTIGLKHAIFKLMLNIFLTPKHFIKPAHRVIIAIFLCIRGHSIAPQGGPSVTQK